MGRQKGRCPQVLYEERKKMEFIGFTGTLAFKGDITPFTPWLKIGEIIHIGKNTSFGFGKYVTKIEK